MFCLQASVSALFSPEILQAGEVMELKTLETHLANETANCLTSLHHHNTKWF